MFSIFGIALAMSGNCLDSYTIFIGLFLYFEIIIILNDFPAIVAKLRLLCCGMQKSIL